MSEMLGFWVACVLALAGNAVFFHMRRRLLAEGHDLPHPFWPRDLWKTLRLYSEEARRRKWAIWPLYFFWVSSLSVIGSLLGIAVSQWGVPK
jgi:hypothetical protein